MKIAFITYDNPYNKISRSGIPYNIFSQLKRFNEVEWINPKDFWLYKLGYFLFCCVMFIFKKMGYRITDHNIFMAKLIAFVMKKPVKKGKYDAIFMLAQIDATYMNYGIPIYIRTDTIFHSAVDYYWFNIPKWFVKHADRLEEIALKKITYLFSTSQWMVDEIRKYHPNLSAENIKVVVSGANLENPYIKYPNRVYGRDKQIKLLFIGYNLKRKGFDVAFDTMKIIRDYYHRDVILTVMGGKPDDNQLKDPNLHYVGKMDKNKKVDFDRFYQALSESNVFIFPTKAEFSAIVNCEAAAYALPIFTYNEGGTSSYVKSGYNGCVFEQGTPANEFAKIIIDSIDSGKMIDYSNHSRKLYEETLNWNHWGDIVNKYIKA